jgi:hypothetical protein
MNEWQQNLRGSLIILLLQLKQMENNNKIVSTTKEDFALLYNEFLKLNYDDPDTNTPIKLLVSRLKLDELMNTYARATVKNR